MNRRKTGFEVSVDPIDLDEQSEIVEKLRIETEQHSTFFRRCLTVIFGCLSFAYLFASVNSIINPFYFVHELMFERSVPNWWQWALFYAASCFVFSSATGVYMIGYARIKYQVICSTVIGVGCTVVWLYVFSQDFVTNPAMLWLPFANVVTIVLAVYVDYDLNKFQDAVDKLHKSKYDFKNL